MTIGLSEWYTVSWILTRGAVRDLAMVETGGHARTVTQCYLDIKLMLNLEASVLPIVY